MRLKLGIKGVFAVGALSGSLAAFYICRDIYNMKYQKKVEELLEEVNEIQLNSMPVDISKNNPVEEIKEPDPTPEVKANEEHLSDPLTRSREELEQYSEVLKKTNYTAYSSEQVHNTEPILVDRHPSAVESISINDFIANVSGYHQISITYYNDGTALDPSTGEDVDILQIVTPEIKDALDSLNDDETIYIRNNEFKVEYDITKEFDSYEED